MHWTCPELGSQETPSIRPAGASSAEGKQIVCEIARYTWKRPHCSCTPRTWRAEYARAQCLESWCYQCYPRGQCNWPCAECSVPFQSSSLKPYSTCWACASWAILVGPPMPWCTHLKSVSHTREWLSDGDHICVSHNSFQPVFKACPHVQEQDLRN